MHSLFSSKLQRKFAQSRYILYSVGSVLFIGGKNTFFVHVFFLYDEKPIRTTIKFIYFPFDKKLDLVLKIIQNCNNFYLIFFIKNSIQCSGVFFFSDIRDSRIFLFNFLSYWKLLSFVNVTPMNNCIKLLFKNFISIVYLL